MTTIEVREYRLQYSLAQLNQALLDRDFTTGSCPQVSIVENHPNLYYSSRLFYIRVSSSTFYGDVAVVDEYNTCQSSVHTLKFKTLNP